MKKQQEKTRNAQVLGHDARSALAVRQRSMWQRSRPRLSVLVPRGGSARPPAPARAAAADAVSAAAASAAAAKVDGGASARGKSAAGDKDGCW